MEYITTEGVIPKAGYSFGFKSTFGLEVVNAEILFWLAFRTHLSFKLGRKKTLTATAKNDCVVSPTKQPLRCNLSWISTIEYVKPTRGRNS